MSIYPELTKDQNQALANYRSSLRAQFKHTSTLSFYNDSAKLRFANRIMVGGHLSSISDKATQVAVADAYLNFYVLSNRMTVNTSMKNAYLGLVWSQSSVRFGLALSATHQKIDENPNLTESQKTTAKASVSVNFSGMYNSIFSNSVTSTKSWAQAKLGLGFNLNFQRVQNMGNNIDSTTFSNIQTSFSAMLSGSFNSINTNLGNLASQPGFSSSVNSSLALSLAATSVQSTNGRTDNDISRNYVKSMSKFSISGDVLLNVINDMENSGVISSLATSLTVSLATEFLAKSEVEADCACF